MKTDLVSRSDIWELAGSMAMTVRPGSELEGIIRRYANAIDNAPAIDAIPVEWLKDAAGRYEYSGCTDSADVIMEVIKDWQKERGANNAIG